jgi:hypothetical protein
LTIYDTNKGIVFKTDDTKEEVFTIGTAGLTLDGVYFVSMNK